jgi:hypothetical protein
MKADEIAAKIEAMMKDLAALPASEVEAVQVIISAIKSKRAGVVVDPAMSEVDRREIADAVYVLQSYPTMES